MIGQDSDGNRRRVMIGAAASADDFAIGRRMFEEYQRAIGVDLCFQNFAAELEVLPRMYGEPDGVLLLARSGIDDDGGGCIPIVRMDPDAVGCIAVRRMGDEPHVCEMKRLYVRETARGTGLGRQLAETSLHVARRLGYRIMRLDTLASMEAAQALYRSLGFRETEAFNGRPNPGTVYMEIDLTAGGDERQ